MNRGNLKCDMCDMMEDETQEHIVVCPGWKEELGSLDVSMMRDHIEFFMRVMRRKEKYKDQGLRTEVCTGDSWPLLVEDPATSLYNMTAGHVLRIDRIDR